MADDELEPIDRIGSALFLICLVAAAVLLVDYVVDLPGVPLLAAGAVLLIALLGLMVWSYRRSRRAGVHVARPIDLGRYSYDL